MRRLVFSALVLLLLTVACGSEEKSPLRSVPESPEAPSTAAPLPAPVPAPEPAPAPVEEEPSDNEVVARALKAAARARSYGGETGLLAQIRESARVDEDFAPLLRRILSRTKGPVFLGKDEGASACALLQAAIEELPAHAIDPEPYPLSALQLSCVRLQRGAGAAAEHEKGPFDDETGRAVWALALAALAGETRDSLEAHAEAAEDASDEQWRTVERWLADVVAARAQRDRDLANADVLLTRAFVRYALDFRYLRRTNPYRKPDKLARRIDAVADRLIDHVDRARKDLAAELKALRPSHPLYDKLRAFLPKYRELAAAGSVPRFHSERRLKPGMSGPEVAALRERLRAEGFEPGPPGERYGDALKAAVVAFQSQRGIAPIAEVGPQTIKALNIPMKRRLQQIEISLQRWRESKLRDAEGRRVRVNLPRYSLGLWDGERVLRRHKVIVGSDRLVSDLSSNQIGYLNRTHLLDSGIYQIILNPYWRVPKRIAVQEIGPEAERDPEYLATKGIELTDGPDGPLYVQKPGEHNPLGQVKFLFRNDWALYLHDTDKRWLFGETRRAFSHGCIRVHEPLDLAREIARLERDMDDKAFRRLVRMGTEYGIDLRDPLPVHIHYVTAEVDDEGTLLLLPDLYRYDRDAISGKLPSNIKRPMKPEEVEREKERRAEKKKR